MRKPLLILGLIGTGLVALPTTDALAATAHSPSLSAHKLSASSSQTTVSGTQIVQFAKRYLGYRYTATGNSPKTGFSCIGFVSYVYRSNGIPLPGSLDGAYNYAPKVPMNQLLPGDVLYFKNTIWPGLSHVGIYVGSGKFIHAEWYNTGVVISSLQGAGWSSSLHWFGANRPWNGPAIGSSTGSTSGVDSPTAPARAGAPGSTGYRAIATARVTASGLRVHSGPSLGAPIVSTAYKGQALKVLKRSGNWLEVQLPNGTVGWVLATYTSAKKASTPKAGTAPVGKHVLTASVRVHAGASVNSRVVSVAAAGTHVRVLRYLGSFDKVQLPTSIKGYVYAQYVR